MFTTYQITPSSSSSVGPARTSKSAVPSTTGNRNGARDIANDVRTAKSTDVGGFVVIVIAGLAAATDIALVASDAVEDCEGSSTESLVAAGMTTCSAIFSALGCCASGCSAVGCGADTDGLEKRDEISERIGLEKRAKGVKNGDAEDNDGGLVADDNSVEDEGSCAAVGGEFIISVILEIGFDSGKAIELKRGENMSSSARTGMIGASDSWEWLLRLS